MPLTADERFADLTNRYLIRIGLAAIFVVGRPGAEPSLMLATDLVAAVRKIEADEDLLIMRRLWFSNASIATKVYEQALKVREQTPLQPSDDMVHDLCEHVHHAAIALGVELRDDRLVSAQCAAAVREIEQVVNAARLSGEMKEINTAYKQHRLSTGKAALSYEEFLHSYKIKAAEAAADRVRSVLRAATS